MAETKTTKTRGRPRKAKTSPKKEEVQEEKVVPAEKKVIEISIDHDPEEVLSYNKDGFTLNFESEPRRFRRLSVAQIKELSKENRTRYYVSKGLHDDAVEELRNPSWMDDAEVGGRLASATARGQVYGKDPSKHYAFQRPDQVRDRKYEGYRITQDPSLDSFNANPDGIHRIGTHGDTEQVLMEIPKEKYKKIQEAQREKTRRMTEGPEDNFMGQTGERAIDPSAYARQSRVQWGPPQKGGKPVRMRAG